MKLLFIDVLNPADEEVANLAIPVPEHVEAMDIAGTVMIELEARLPGYDFRFGALDLPDDVDGLVTWAVTSVVTALN